MKNVLPTLIHPDQNAFAKGRSIFDAVRTIDDLLEGSSWSPSLFTPYLPVVVLFLRDSLIRES